MKGQIVCVFPNRFEAVRKICLKLIFSFWLHSREIGSEKDPAINKLSRIIGRNSNTQTVGQKAVAEMQSDLSSSIKSEMK